MTEPQLPFPEAELIDAALAVAREVATAPLVPVGGIRRSMARLITAAATYEGAAR